MHKNQKDASARKQNKQTKKAQIKRSAYQSKEFYHHWKTFLWTLSGCAIAPVIAARNKVDSSEETTCETQDVDYIIYKNETKNDIGESTHEDKQKWRQNNLFAQNLLQLTSRNDKKKISMSLFL